MTGQQDRAPGIGPLPKQPADPPDPLRVQAVDRLVEDQYLRVAQQRRRQPQALPHSQGEGAHPPPGRLTQPDDVEHLSHPTPTDARTRGHPTQVAAGRARGVRARAVEHRSHRAQRFAQLTVGAPADERPPAVGPVQTQQTPQGRGLPGAVRPHESGDAARTGLQAHAVKHLPRPVPLDEVLNRDHGPTPARRAAARIGRPAEAVPPPQTQVRQTPVR